MRQYEGYGETVTDTTSGSLLGGSAPEGAARRLRRHVLKDILSARTGPAARDSGPATPTPQAHRTRAMPVVFFAFLTWKTFRCMPMIGVREAAFLNRFLPAEVRRHGASMIALGMVRDHVHMVLRLPGQIDLPRLVQGLKGASARLINRDARNSLTGLRWAAGYSAYSVSPRNLDAVVRYVKGQATRHPDRAIG